MLENRIFKYDLDVYEFKIYAYLCMRADRKTMTCFPSVAKAAAECGISESKVRRVVSTLEEKGFISKRERFLKSLRGRNHQTSNLYHIEDLPVCDTDNPVPSACTPCTSKRAINKTYLTKIFIKNHYNKKVRSWI